ncbi:MAG TPA: alanine racemase [Acidobacteriaceae bacterium]
MSSWIEVSEERLAGNFRAVTDAAGAETEVLAVVKANAYGHGADVCAVALARAGARWLGVACASEGAPVRRALDTAGFAGERAPEILVLCGLMAEDVAVVVEHGLTPVVWTREQAEWLRGAGVAVHVEVDTGMGRQGVREGADLGALLDTIGAAGLVLDGAMTHFLAAEVVGSEKTREQERRFAGVIAQIRERGLRPKWVHAGSSSTVDNPARDSAWLPELAKSVGAQAMMRSGIALYGYCLPIEGADAGMGPRIRAKVKPVMQWKTRVLDVREVSVGETVGYNATFTAPGPMRLALLPVGYSDGLRRELSSTNERPGGWVVIRGHRAAVVGRVSMNLTLVDVTGIDGVRLGDEVLLLGDGATADDHARVAGTISYEILCGARAGQEAVIV